MSGKKKEFLLFLQNLVKVLSFELLSIEKEIEIQVAKIDSIVERMKRVAQDIVAIENKKKNLQLVLGDLKSSAEKEKSIIDSLIREMDELKSEADRLILEIKSRRAQIDSLGIFSGLAAGLMELVDSLTGDLRNAQNRIDQYQIKWEEMKTNLIKSEQKEQDYEQRIEAINNEKNKLDSEQDRNDKKIKELGVMKTNQENFKLDLKQFKSRAQSLLDTVNLNIEFSDEMLNTKEDLMNQIRELYDKNNRKLPKALFDPPSSTSYTPVPVASYYRISSL